MWLTVLGFALLVWVPAVLHAVGTEERCVAPDLKDGYFLPVQESYPHKTPLTYSCDPGYKTTKEGWWVMSVCENGAWDYEPECIAETACLLPVIPNGKFKQSSKDWHKDGSEIEINCNEGYFLNNQSKTIQCTNGTWSSTPVCEKHPSSCGEPPNIPNAVIVNHIYKGLYQKFSKVKYVCRDGFLTEDEEPKKDVYCVDGSWSHLPNCRRSTKPGSRINQPALIPIENCGEFPNVRDGIVGHETPHSLQYKCQQYYKLVGSETVVCQSDNTWSDVPICKENFCLLRQSDYPNLDINQNHYLFNGEEKRFICVGGYWVKYSQVHCINRKVHASKCCQKIAISLNIC